MRLTRTSVCVLKTSPRNRSEARPAVPYIDPGESKKLWLYDAHGYEPRRGPNVIITNTGPSIVIVNAVTIDGVKFCAFEMPKCPPTGGW